MVEFGDYTGPIFFLSYTKSVPIVPIMSQTYFDGDDMEQIELPLRLCWAIRIHKSQELTLKSVWVELGMNEKVTGLAYIGISRVKSIYKKEPIEPMFYERLVSVKSSHNLS